MWFKGFYCDQIRTQKIMSIKIRIKITFSWIINGDQLFSEIEKYLIKLLYKMWTVLNIDEWD